MGERGNQVSIIIRAVLLCMQFAQAIKTHKVMTLNCRLNNLIIKEAIITT